MASIWGKNQKIETAKPDDFIIPELSSEDIDRMIEQSKNSELAKPFQTPFDPAVLNMVID